MWNLIPRSNNSLCKLIFKQIKNCSSISKIKFSSILTTSTIYDCNQYEQKLGLTLEQAQKVIDVPLNRFLITNLARNEYDIFNFALRKTEQLKDVFQSSQHPILNVAEKLFTTKRNSDSMEQVKNEIKELINNSEYNIGSVVLLLLARCLETIPSFKMEKNTEYQDKKYFKQISLAECYEIIDKAIYIHHNAVMNFPLKKFYDENEQSEFYSDELDVETKSKQAIQFSNLSAKQMNICNQINNGNKLSILGGDYLFSFGIIRLAELVYNTHAFDFVGAAIDDYVINQFPDENQVKNHFKGNCETINIPWSNVVLTDYEIYSGHGANSLLAYCAQFNATLSDLSSIRYEKACFELCWNLRIKWNINEDLKWLRNPEDTSLRLFSLPIVLYIQQHPEYYIELKNKFQNRTLNISNIKQQVNTESILKQCTQIQVNYSNNALAALRILPNNNNAEVLKQLILL